MHTNDSPKYAQDQRGNFRTSDLYYAAYLRVAGVEFRGTEKEGSRTFFLFENSDNMRDLKVQFFNGSSKVAAQPYADAIKAMKSLTHDSE
jgi:hypothetical protein